MFLKKNLALLMERVSGNQIFTESLRAPSLCVTKGGKKVVNPTDLGCFSESCDNLILRLQNSRVNRSGLRVAIAGMKHSLWENNIIRVLTLGPDA